MCGGHTMAVLLLRSILRKMTGVDGVSNSSVVTPSVLSGRFSGLLLFVLLQRGGSFFHCLHLAESKSCPVRTPWRCCCCEASCAR
jgi:hypothetical protein